MIRWTIFKRGLLLISLPLIAQFILAGYLLKAYRDATEAEKWSAHSKQVLALANEVHADLIEAQGATRGFVITANPTFDKQALQAESAARNALGELRTLTADNPEQQARVIELREQVDELLRWITEQRQFVTTNRMDEAVERVKNLQGIAKLQKVRQAKDAFLAKELELDRERTQNVKAAATAQLTALGAGLLASVVVTSVAVYLFGKSIVTRMEVAKENARRLADNEVLMERLEGDDEVANLDAAMHDASRRLKAAAAAEQEYKLELERRASDMARTNESLRQQTQENEMFVYSVSHDLRSPLVNLQGFSRELMHAGEDLKALLADDRIPEDVRRRATELLEQDVVTSVKFIQTAVSRSGAIIDALLRLSRAGRIEYRITTVDVGAIVSRVIDAMQSTITQKDAQIVVRELGSVEGDSTAVEQIFGNLIGNAVNYLDPSRRGVIEVGMLNEGEVDGAGLRTFYVRDNGLGIPSAYLGKVFVAFQRLHGEVAKGEGIGLALVRRMIERHGGRAWVESTVGIGTTFFVALPAGGRPHESNGQNRGEQDNGHRPEPAREPDRVSTRNEAFV